MKNNEYLYKTQVESLLIYCKHIIEQSPSAKNKVSNVDANKRMGLAIDRALNLVHDQDFRDNNNLNTPSSIKKFFCEIARYAISLEPYLAQYKHLSRYPTIEQLSAQFDEASVTKNLNNTFSAMLQDYVNVIADNPDPRGVMNTYTMFKAAYKEASGKDFYNPRQENIDTKRMPEALRTPVQNKAESSKTSQSESSLSSLLAISSYGKYPSNVLRPYDLATPTPATNNKKANESEADSKYQSRVLFSQDPSQAFSKISSLKEAKTPKFPTLSPFGKMPLLHPSDLATPTPATNNKKVNKSETDSKHPSKVLFPQESPQAFSKILSSPSTKVGAFESLPSLKLTSEKGDRSSLLRG